MPRPSDLLKEGTLYCIRSTEQGAVKIGFATDTYTRLKSLQSGNPWLLEIAALVPATYGAELALHKALKKRAVRLEWYPDDEFMGYLVDELQDISLDMALAWLEDQPGYGVGTNSLEEAANQIQVAREKNPLTAEHVRSAVETALSESLLEA